MSIVLRTNKGSALTYDEMDRNQSQFFYSSSKSPDGLKLRLHYTGSDNLDTTVDFGPTRYHEVSFPVFESEVPDSNVAGNNSEIQFNRTVSGTSNFAAKPTFVFTENNNSVGIGANIPSERLEIRGDGARGGNIALRGSVNNEGEVQSLAGVKFYSGITDATLLGQVGRLEFNSDNFADDIYIHSGDFNPTPGFAPDIKESRSVHISLGGLTPNITPATRIGATFTRTGSGETRVGINNSIPNLNLSVVGNSGIGLSDSSLETNSHSNLKPITSSNAYHLKVNSFGAKVLVPNNSTGAGLEISSPKTPNGGNILMVINTDTSEKNEGFNIITTTESSADDATLLATFQASGKVGIGTNTPLHEGLTVEKELTVKTRQVATTLPTSPITRALVATSTGLIKEVVAAAVPKGGIIMWSGDIADIPSGWRLCKNGVGTVNGVTVPNLSNKFIIASNNITGTPTTTILGGAATDTGGSTSYTPEGTLTLDKLLTTDLAPHHHFFLADDRVYNNLNTNSPNDTDTIGGPGSSSGTAATGVRTIGGYDGSSDYSGNRRVYATSKNSRFTTTNSTTIMQTATQTRPTGAFTGTIASKAIIPPFYALAYIIYVGV